MGGRSEEQSGQVRPGMIANFIRDVTLGPGTLSLSSIITSIGQSLKHHKRNSPKYEDFREDNHYQDEHTKDPNQEFEVFQVPEQKYVQPIPTPEPVGNINWMRSK